MNFTEIQTDIFSEYFCSNLSCNNLTLQDPSSPCDVIPMRRKLLGADQGDLRRTLAQISSHVSLNVHYNHQVIPLGGLDKACVQEEQEDDQEGNSEDMLNII